MSPQPRHATRSRWGAVREEFIRWVTRRHRADGARATITRDRVYILPTRQGYLLLAVLLAMLLGSINYSNNMAFLLTFLIAGIGHNAMWYTHRNLLGLRLTALPVRPVFAGESPTLVVRAEEPSGRLREALEVRIGDRKSRFVHLETGGSGEFTVALGALPRGTHQLPRQRISTRYPLGLLEAWSWLTLDTEILVYPRPIAAAPWNLAADDTPGGDVAAAKSADGIPDDIREYRPGDTPSRMAWKAVARTGHLMVRDASAGEGRPVWLDWEQTTGPDIEFRLSVLCHQVLEANAGGRSYGLRMPGFRSSPATGPEHLAECLRALAVFGHRSARA